MTRHLASVFGLVLATALAAAPALARDLNVVVSIKPVHALAAALMKGAGTPSLLIDGAASPHATALKPSQARMLAEADVIFWVGPQIETFLEKPLAALPDAARRVALFDAAGMLHLPVREAGLFDEDAGGHDHGHAHEGEEDGHIWLDPQNAKAMARAMAEALAAADPTRATLYEENRAALDAALEQLTKATQEALARHSSLRFVVFHDAFQYFEARFGLRAAGTVTINPEQPPGARRVAAIRQSLAAQDIACIFAEPQFSPRIVEALVEGTGVRIGVLDPLGADLAAGEGHYEALIGSIAEAIAACAAPH